MRHHSEQTTLVWEVVEYRRDIERVIGKFIYHEDAKLFWQQKIKAHPHLEFDLRQARKVRKR